MNEWMNEWMNSRIVDWMNKRTNKQTNKWINESVSEWMNKQTNKLTNKQTNEWMNEWIVESVSELINSVHFRISLSQKKFRTGTKKIKCATLAKPYKADLSDECNNMLQNNPWSRSRWSRCKNVCTVHVSVYTSAHTCVHIH